MQVLFDPEKDSINLAKHGVSLRRANEFDFDGALYAVDDSQDYGEVRIGAIGFLGAALYVLIFSPRGEEAIRAISLRRATRREHQLYAKEQ